MIPGWSKWVTVSETACGLKVEVAQWAGSLGTGDRAWCSWAPAGLQRHVTLVSLRANFCLSPQASPTWLHLCGQMWTYSWMVPVADLDLRHWWLCCGVSTVTNSRHFPATDLPSVLSAGL